MVLINNITFEKDLHIIIRFITECQLKHSFIFNDLIRKDVDKCLNYLIKKQMCIKTKIPFNKEKIKSILKTVVNNSIGIELIFCEDDNPLVDKSLLEKLENILNLL